MSTNSYSCRLLMMHDRKVGCAYADPKAAAGGKEHVARGADLGHAATGDGGAAGHALATSESGGHRARSDGGFRARDVRMLLLNGLEAYNAEPFLISIFVVELEDMHGALGVILADVQREHARLFAQHFCDCHAV